MRGKDLQPSELKIMNIVWQEHPIPAKRIVQLLTPETGWSKNTIYTLTTRIIAKGFIRRTDPGFVCEPLVTREEVQRRENQSLLKPPVRRLGCAAVCADVGRFCTEKG